MDTSRIVELTKDELFIKVSSPHFNTKDLDLNGGSIYNFNEFLHYCRMEKYNPFKTSIPSNEYFVAYARYMLKEIIMALEHFIDFTDKWELGPTVQGVPMVHYKTDFSTTIHLRLNSPNKPPFVLIFRKCYRYTVSATLTLSSVSNEEVRKLITKALFLHKNMCANEDIYV
jgi:hypothetical protein